MTATPIRDPYRILEVRADDNRLVTARPSFSEARALCKALAEQHGGGPSSLTFAVYHRGRRLALYGAEGRLLDEREEVLVAAGQGRTAGELVDAASAAAVSFFGLVLVVLGAVWS